ncbi:MmgE/PrpD family protein, partial [Castellaniella sp.]|uniref:MmgE/PrpD family protein n=1 Tax=Castellaniella sp. TaxID=1955812 RepID=UPI003562E4C7
SLDHVPSEVIDYARHLVLDAVGCALAARPEAFAHVYSAAITELAGVSGAASDAAHGCAVIGQAFRLPVREAALLNGILAHGLDFDDTHIAGIAHLSVAVWPAVMALAAHHQRSGRQAFLAYVVGLEVGSRVAAAAPGLFHARGFHPTLTVGLFAAAVACAQLLGLDRDGIHRAQGFALSMTGGSLQFVEDGAWTKRLHPGWAASSGIACAILARHPIPTPGKVYEGRFGLFRAFLGDANQDQVALGQITDHLGAHWQLKGIGVKPFPVCHFNHACADASIALHRRLFQAGASIRSIRRIEVRAPKGVMPSVCEPADIKRHPTTEYEAKFSMHYAVACGLLRGHLGLEDLAPDAIADPEVGALMRRVDCVADPASTFPRHYTGEVVLFFEDGTTMAHRENVNRGHAERPLDNDAIQAKFRANAARALSAAQVQALERFIVSMDADLRSLRTMDSLVTPEPPSPLSIQESRP